MQHPIDQDAGQSVEQNLRAWPLLVVVGGAALLVRGLLLLVSLAGYGPFGDFSDDPDSYRLIAETLAQHGTFGIPGEGGNVDPTAFRPPLYPWLLSWLVRDGQLSAAAVAGLHSLLGALTAMLVFAFVCQYWPRSQDSSRQPQQPNRPIAWLAATLVTIDPLLLTQSTQVMTETLATLLAVATWLAICWANTGAGNPEAGNLVGRAGGRWFIVGLLLAAGFLCRPVFIVWAVLLVLWLIGREIGRNIGKGGAMTRAAGVVCMVLLPLVVTVSSWTLRNDRQLGQPVWATSHGGYTLLLGNNPEFYTYLRNTSFRQAAWWGKAWPADAFHDQWAAKLRQLAAQRAQTDRADSAAFDYTKKSDPELAQDRLASEWAKETIWQSPGMFFYASLVRVARLWSPIPRVGDRVGLLSWLLGGYYSAILAATAWGLYRAGGSIFSAPIITAILFAAALTAVHAVYWSNIRMRSPLMPMVLTLAGGQLLVGTRRESRGSPE
ncbi:hypothetical protein SH139x_000319 [Planctomycetaceae bacterium SH139]